MKAALTGFFFAALAILTAGADETAVIPAAHALGRYEPAWAKNPFHRRVREPRQPQATFSADWTLQGMADYDGKVRVTIVNKQTGERRHVTSDDAPAAEFHLIRANFSRYPADAFAVIEKGTERGVIKYSERP
jgi:hypothetical protein